MISPKPPKWFASDHHFYHKNIIKYCQRPFVSVDEMNRVMIERHNQAVSEDDEVWFLGDFAFAKLAPMRKIFDQLKGKITLVAGNHDNLREVADLGFGNIIKSAELEISGQSVKVSHYPYFNPDAKDLRYEERRPSNEGGWLLHGHVHEKWKVEGKQINVGVDVWNFYPAHIETIEQIIKGNT